MAFLFGRVLKGVGLNLFHFFKYEINLKQNQRIHSTDSTYCL